MEVSKSPRIRLLLGIQIRIGRDLQSRRERNFRIYKRLEPTKARNLKSQNQFALEPRISTSYGRPSYALKWRYESSDDLHSNTLHRHDHHDDGLPLSPGAGDESGDVRECSRIINCSLGLYARRPVFRD